MKKTLSVITFIAVIALMAGSAMARPGGGYGGGPGYCGGPGYGGGPGFHRGGQPFHHLDRLQYHLGLTDKQVEQIYEINKKFQDRYFKNRKNRPAIEKIRVEHQKAIESVLNADQKKKLKEFYENRGNRRGGPGAKDKGGKRGYGPRGR